MTPNGPNNTAFAIKCEPSAGFLVSLSTRNDGRQECNFQCNHPNWSKKIKQYFNQIVYNLLLLNRFTYIFYTKIEFHFIDIAHFITHPKEFLILEDPIFRCVILQHFQALRNTSLDIDQAAEIQNSYIVKRNEIIVFLFYDMINLQRFLSE